MGEMMTIETGLEIAVIGMAGRFPGAKNIHRFWDDLKNGKELVSFFSAEELKEAGVEPELLNNPNYVKAYGLLEDIDCFDASFFGYTPREAEIMDPQIRIFHECVWAALEDAGYDPGTYDGLIGLYAGATLNLNWAARAILSGKDNEIGSFAAGQLIQKDYLTLRISYKLNLMGPSFVLNTACSTSLVAIHLACQSLLNGECDMALAGGVTVVGLSKRGYMYREGMISSPDGHCRAFDAAAKGIVVGDGAGVVLLKRLEDAVSDRDYVYAVVKGTAINNDGIRKAGFTASSVEGQAEVIKMALQMAEVEPWSIGYIETHGTGTELGDPVEIEGLKLAFNTDRRGFCAVGSVKTNIGHVDSAAGVAGFIKTVLALKHRLIPPTLHFETPNPGIDFINSPFYLASKLTEWENGDYPLRAGVSSFGIGGTNAHVVLEEWPGNGKQKPEGSKHHLIVLSAKTSSALDELRENLKNYFEDNKDINLADAAYTLQVGRKAFKHRWMAVCSSVDEVVEALASSAGGETYTVSPEEESSTFERIEPVVDKDSLTRIGRLWLCGRKIDWKEFCSKEKRYRLSLPTYPFERQHYWIDEGALDFNTDRAKKTFRLNKDSYTNTGIGDWFYLPSWKLTARNPRRDKDSFVKGCWLIFVNRLTLGERLVKQLKEKGENVLIVEKGRAFSQVDDNGCTYTINPQESSHYDTLFNNLRAGDVVPDKIVHLWSVTGENSSLLDAESFDDAQYPGFYSLLYMVKAIGKQNFSNDIYISVLTDHLQEVIGGEHLAPEKATVMGILKSIPQEYPGLRCRSIDINAPEPGSPEEITLVDTLMEELTADSPDPVIAYRNNRRWVQIYEPFPLEEPPAELPLFRKQGVYLVTGGLGAIGLIFSELLVKHAGARLILTGRSAFPSKEEWEQWLESHDEADPVSFKIKKLQTLEEMGGQVLYLQADVGDREQMRAAVFRAEKKFGKIHGVIHSAGIIEGESMRSIQELSEDECRLQFKAKVYGTMVLEELFRDKKLDFCWMLSSISCVLGGLGFGAYASANFFMDVFVKRYNRSGGSRWFSLNWDGMDAHRSTIAFERAFSLEKVDVVAFSKGGNLQDRIDKWIKLETVKEMEASGSGVEDISAFRPRPELPGAYVAPRNSEEKAVADIWQSLLGYEKIGVQDDFLELGGDSLKAITVISRIHQALNINIPVTEFFNKPTVEGIVGYISRGSRENSYVSIEAAEAKEYYPLSPAQKRLYILQQVDDNSTGYNISTLVEVEGNLPRQRFEAASEELIRRHEALRTSIDIVNGEPVQRVHDRVRSVIEYFEHHDVFVEVEKIIQGFIRPFDLSRAPLLRLGLLQIDAAKHILMIDTHHIVSDGVSLEIFTGDFMRLFREEKLPPLRVRYKDFCQWQSREKQQKELEKQAEYWLREFEANIPELTLPMDYERPVKRSFEGDAISFEIDENKTEGLREIASNTNATLFMVLIAIYNIFLSKLSGQDEIIVGTGTAGRRHPDLQNIIGMFVNTLALKHCPKKEITFKTFLKEVREKTLLAFENQDYPFEALVEKVVPDRNWNRNPLFNTVIVSQNLDIKLEAEDTGNIESPELKITPYSYRNKVSNFDMGLLWREIGDKLHFTLEYSTKLFRRETIQRFAGYFKEIVSQVLENDITKIEDISVSHHLLRAEANNFQMELGF